MVAEGAATNSACPWCDGGAPRLYELPEKARLSQAAPRAACYFCYVRLVGIKPTRRQVVS
jgi:hypothetical protein